MGSVISTQFTFDREQLRRSGFARAGVLSADWPDQGPEHPVRDVLGSAGWMHDLARRQDLRDLASSALGGDARVVRANLFVKSKVTNWFVPWHQDRVVCVRRRVDFPGFTSWSTKAGLPHANAPFEVLREMIAIRVHLDPSPTEGGALEVLPGTQESVRDPEGVRDGGRVSECLPATRGELLLMRPLVVHRSSKSRSGLPRRVLHVEYSSRPLPAPLQFHYW